MFDSDIGLRSKIMGSFSNVACEISSNRFIVPDFQLVLWLLVVVPCWPSQSMASDVGHGGPLEESLVTA